MYDWEEIWNLHEAGAFDSRGLNSTKQHRRPKNLNKQEIFSKAAVEKD